MTYNFDPDQWFETQADLLKKRLDAGEIDRSEYEKSLKDLHERHEAMWKRLDGTYRIPDDKDR